MILYKCGGHPNIHLSPGVLAAMIADRKPGEKSVMGINDGMLEPLIGEILDDVASSFFEARRTIEAKIDHFHEFVKTLRKMAADVQSRAALLNLLLVDDRQAEAYYRMLGLDGEVFLDAKIADPHNVLSGIPFGIGFCSRYTKLVFTVYSNLQEAGAIYLNGPPQSIKMPARPDQEFIYYHLIVKMHQVLNHEIKRINDTTSPSCTLQFAKEFKPDLMTKERVTGGGISDPQALDEKLCYRQIDLNTLGLLEFPLLPKLDDVRPSVKRFCKDLHSRYPNELKEILEFIRQRISAD